MARIGLANQHLGRCGSRLPPGLMKKLIPLLAVSVLLAWTVTSTWAGIGGSVSGTVKDRTNALVPSAVVKATNIDTGVEQQVQTNDQGYYSFPDLPVGRYSISIARAGFRLYQRSGITIDTNSSVIVDAVLEIGEQAQSVTVIENAVQVETSNTQMGDVTSGGKMAAVPLNGRSFTDLLALQPGVVPATSLTADTQQDVGVSALSPSGNLNPGTISINGQREFANAFIVNGSDAEEDVNSAAAIIPNLDSIAEFRILTGDFDAEYGGYTGGQVNVVTKSGANEFHGDLFEFLRNTSFDSRNYFSPTRGAFDQNQFGGTWGGPIRRNRIFFFADYQGTRLTQGVDTGQIPVPSFQDRSGNLSDLESSLTGTVTGQYWANLLSGELAYPVSPGEPYYSPGCVSSSQCVLPDGVIPLTAWSLPAKHLLPYIPRPNVGADSFATSSYDQPLRDDKGAYRLDSSGRWGLLNVYYFLDDYTLNNPYPVAQSGASVPGFAALYLGRAQLLSLGDTKTLGTSAANELHLSYMRDHNDLGKPVGGLGVSLMSQGFVTGPGTPGIVPLNPQGEGVENIVFNAYSIGTNANELRQANNTFQGIDNFSKVVDRHTMKFGVEFHYDQISTNAIAQFNGNFLFTGSETGSDFADFLLGIPSQYNQSQLQPFYGRNRYWGPYAQDSWRLRSNMTLNYGLRWDRIEPWYEKNNGISTFEPGKSSVVFPGAPAGILFPTDPGIPRTLAPAGNLDFSPRIGVAYAPNTSGDTLLGKILGGPGETSLRAGFGLYYSSIEALTIGILAGNAPFGITYSSPAPPLFSTPFITASSGQNQGQPFPVALVSKEASSSDPNSDINWSQFEPISGIPGYATSNRIPYVRQYMLSIERQLGAKTILSASYVGTEGRRLLVMVEANPGNPALCLGLSEPQDVAPGTPTCGPFEENNVFTTASGQLINGTRGPLGPNFGSDTLQQSIGESNYNALELSLHHTSGRLEISAGYTYGKSMDDSSNLGEEVNPIRPPLSYALSSFDIRQNFVVSYDYKCPLERLFRASNRWTQGWELSGITHFSTGLPVTLLNYGDNSLLGAEPNGINNYGVDEPDFTPGPLELNHNPRNGQPYFNTALFRENALGTPGNAKRRFFPGPGLDNYDMALLKNIGLTEGKTLQLRVEGFNIFNHAQFFGPQTVNGDINSSAFGQFVSADAPRLVQLGAKFLF
ncbi:MAG TPA: carboxypeptidase regulatory-like domain-containing protein [Candidatus Cybelea sp.]|nr:carboxypeptidase regulatory-like domain-containing protein [Candidatus Cybelea sp.]